MGRLINSVLARLLTTLVGGYMAGARESKRLTKYFCSDFGLESLSAQA